MCLPEDGAYSLSFEEHFDGNRLDSITWQTYLPCSDMSDDQCLWARTHCTQEDCNEAQIFRDENVTVADGLCTIAVSKEKNSWMGVNRKYTSGMIYSREAYKKYGRYEIRCDMPHGDAYWPAFWMFGWSAEIDVAEYGGKTNEYAVGVHKWDHRGSVDPFIEKVTSELSLTEGMHVYAVEYDPYRVKFYLDDRLVSTMHRYSTLAGEPVTDCGYLEPQILIEHYAYPRPSSPLHIIVNVALWYWADRKQYDFKADSLQIDYIRYYERDYPCGYAPEVMRIADEKTIATSRTLRKVVVEDGATLTLRGQPFYFESDGGIVVQTGGTLILENATLTACHTGIPWQGVDLEAGSSLLSSSAKVAHAAVGLSLPSHGGDTSLQSSGALHIEHCDIGLIAPKINALSNMQDTILITDCEIGVQSSEGARLAETPLRLAGNKVALSPYAYEPTQRDDAETNPITWQMLLSDMNHKRTVQPQKGTIPHSRRQPVSSAQLQNGVLELLIRMRATL